MAKSALKDAGLKQSDYLLIELDERDDGSAIQDALVKITGARTVGLHFFVLELVKYLFYYENWHSSSKWPGCGKKLGQFIIKPG